MSHLRARYALARLGLTHEDLLTIQRGFMRSIAAANAELMESFNGSR